LGTSLPTRDELDNPTTRQTVNPATSANRMTDDDEEEEEEEEEDAAGTALPLCRLCRGVPRLTVRRGDLPITVCVVPGVSRGWAGGLEGNRD
jgi:hypothetical protein